MSEEGWGTDVGLLIISLAALISVGAIAQAEVSLKCNFYNTEDDVSMSLEGENLEFGAQVILAPDFLSYENGGSSNGAETHYSYSVGFNGETISSGAETNNGVFSWGAIANSNTDGEGSKAFSVNSRSQVQDGYLKTNSANSNLNIERSIAVDNGYYSEASTIDASNLNSKGSGMIGNEDEGTSTPADDLTNDDKEANPEGSQKTDTNDNTPITTKDYTPNTFIAFDQTQPSEDNTAIAFDQTQPSEDKTSPSSKTTTSTGDDTKVSTDTPVASEKPGSTSQNNGFIQLMSMQNDDGKKSSVNTVVQGDTLAQWGNNVETRPTLAVFEVGVDGHTHASVDALNLGMMGKATGYPTQSLPPGSIKIDSTTTAPDSNNDDKAIKAQEFIESCVGDFNTDYGLSPKVLWYYLNQNAWVNPIPEDPTEGGSTSNGDYYHMGMGFAFKE